MMISGKSAERKNRFKAASRVRVAGWFSPPDPVTRRYFGLMALRDEVRMEDCHVRQVSVPLREVEAVADHEVIRDLEADVADVDVDLASLRLGHQRANLQRGRITSLERAHEVGERQARVDDVLDHEHVPGLDVDVEVLEDADDARRVGGRAVAGDGHEVDLARHGQAAHQVGHEEHGALEHADQEQVATGVVGGDLLAQLGDPVLQRDLVDEDALDGGQQLGLAHARSSTGKAGASALCASVEPTALAHASSRVARTPSCSTIPGTQTTSSPRTTRGQASRSERGTFASTNTSWIFFERPASRSPGRQARTLRPGRSDWISQPPQRTSPVSATGALSSQTRSSSRTTTRPAPRSRRFVPTGSARSSASSGGIVRLSASRARLASAAGCSLRSSGSTSRRM